MVETVLLKKVIDLLSSAIGSLFKKSRLIADEKESGKLISEAIQELLSVNPNLHKARSKLQLAKNKWPSPSEDLYRAQEILQHVTNSGKRRPGSIIRRGKKVAKKKSAKKKVAKKKR